MKRGTRCVWKKIIVRMNDETTSYDLGPEENMKTLYRARRRNLVNEDLEIVANIQENKQESTDNHDDAQAHQSSESDFEFDFYNIDDRLLVVEADNFECLDDSGFFSSQE